VVVAGGGVVLDGVVVFVLLLFTPVAFEQSELGVALGRLGLAAADVVVVPVAVPLAPVPATDPADGTVVDILGCAAVDVVEVLEPGWLGSVALFKSQFVREIGVLLGPTLELVPEGVAGDTVLVPD
jgi:hypothetical protein